MEHNLLVEKVTSLIDQIRPYLQQDGGDIQFIEITLDNIVRVQLRGACGSCPHAKITLKHMVEATIMEHCPEIAGVEDINLV
ncbi:MAG: NifU family protein [Bacteroidales bacterium]|jgi:Fe-S cluster biogenesis protein NfuA|nr:NifU family protein [Bacteroidales bacterium]